LLELLVAVPAAALVEVGAFVVVPVLELELLLVVDTLVDAIVEEW